MLLDPKSMIRTYQLWEKNGCPRVPFPTAYMARCLFTLYFFVFVAALRCDKLLGMAPADVAELFTSDPGEIKERQRIIAALLPNAGKCACIYSTHIHELTAYVNELNKNGERVMPMCVEMKDGERTYRIIRGKVDDLSHAYDIAKKYGLEFAE